MIARVLLSKLDKGYSLREQRPIYAKVYCNCSRVNCINLSEDKNLPYNLIVTCSSCQNTQKFIIIYKDYLQSDHLEKV